MPSKKKPSPGKKVAASKKFVPFGPKGKAFGGKKDKC